MKTSFMSMLTAKWQQRKFVCVGLDIDLAKIPKDFCLDYPDNFRIELFNQEIVKHTIGHVCCYKINSAFFEARGSKGIDDLATVVEYIKKKNKEQSYPVPIILDYKRADIGNTNEGYAKSAFEDLGVDAVTVNPYFGSEAMSPYLSHKDKGVIVLCRTSNPGASELQDLYLQTNTGSRRVFEQVAENIRDKWNYNDNCLLVVGATAPEQLKSVRTIVGDMPLLIPGVGKQGGSIKDVVESGLDSNYQGIIINSSRDVIYASGMADDFAIKAMEVVTTMNSEIRRCIREVKKKKGDLIEH